MHPLGFTIPSVDLLLEPYAELSYKKYIQKYVELGLDKDKAEEIALKEIQRDFEQGFQGWEYKFNSVSSSRGDHYGNDRNRNRSICQNGIYNHVECKKERSRKRRL